MNLIQTQDRLQLPVALKTQFHDFRRHVWLIKLVEAASIALCAAVIPFLLMFGLDRFWDSPVWARGTLFSLVVCGCATVPFTVHRWVWRNRSLDQLAKLLRRKHPVIGDQLLGIIELVSNDGEQERSRMLCQAAVEQVAQDARKRNFGDAVPNSRHWFWTGMAIISAVAALALALVFPTAAANAWARLVVPWNDTPRYTFTAVDFLPQKLVVAHGEPFKVTLKLHEQTISHPTEGVVQVGRQRSILAALRDGQYEFELPAQIGAGRLQIQIGDFRQTVQIEPKLRPELTSVAADYTLPEYLGRPEHETKEVRGGVLSLVSGSRVELTATAGRVLSSAAVDGVPQSPRGATITSPPIDVEGSRRVEFQWQDEFGLTGREPFALTLTGRDDEAPSLVVEDLPRQKVVIESETLTFKIRAHDDFGVKTVGIEWKGDESAMAKSSSEGERLLAAGGHDRELLELTGTFSAKSLGIEPQPVNVRVFVEDYFPGRERVYSPTHKFSVLTAEQHAIWITEQLSKWHRQSLEIRDREIQLYEMNKQLRELSREDRSRPETQRRIENQAEAERANGRRLSNVVHAGEELVKQAMRNPEIGVDHLETWAEMLQILKDISGNRMPSVADLLKQASQAAAADNQESQKKLMAGQVRASGDAKSSKPSDKPQRPKPAVPQVVDSESSQQPRAKTNGDEEPAPASQSESTLRLPVTTLMGGSSGKKQPAAATEDKIDEAIQQQQDLLAEFEKIAEELNRVLANLEGSTLVKRLKAAARLQHKLARTISGQLKDTFGVNASQIGETSRKAIDEIAGQESKASLDVSFIMDDMQACFEKRKFVIFKSILDEMRHEDVIASLRQLGDDLRQEHGMSIAQAEFWSDMLDRWAEDLVAGPSGSGPGPRSKGSLPPSLVLEVLQILEGEVNLREETRVAEQGRPALVAEEYEQQATKLSGTQAELRERIGRVVERIRELPDAEAVFAREIRLLGMVSEVMTEATGILARPNTGPQAIAAETEAIELLLQSDRINPNSSAGGGASPNGGGGGTTRDSALSLMGTGVNDKEVRQDRGVSQATGQSGSSLPQEFRAGLDKYFNRLERGPQP
ncbi:MAG: hypothetical protein HY290_10370 [Planctomycetia bacterium]|nr:hypothetical protein [Planctomycetia bacterium]